MKEASRKEESQEERLKASGSVRCFLTVYRGTALDG